MRRIVAGTVALLLPLVALSSGVPATSRGAEMPSTLTGQPGEVLRLDIAAARTAATPLRDLVIRESNAGEIGGVGEPPFQPASLLIAAPEPFAWQPGTGAVTVRQADSPDLECGSVTASISVTAQQILVSFTRHDLARRCVVTVSGIHLAPVPATAAPVPAVRITGSFNFGPSIATYGWLGLVQGTGTAPTLAASVSASVTTWHTPIMLRGTLGGGPGVLAVERSFGGTTWVISNEAAQTDATGRIALAFDPRETTFYRFVFAGDATRAATTSNLVRVIVRYRAMQSPIHSTARTIRRGTSVTFTTTVRPAGAGRPMPTVQFRLYRRTSGVWRLAATRWVVASETGIARTTIRFAATGDWYVRSQVLGTSTNATSYSTPIARFRVVG